MGQKVFFDIMCKCFYNYGVKDMGLSMEQLLVEDQGEKFLKLCYQEDKFEYLYALLLECPDNLARTAIGNMLKRLLNNLKLKEKDYLNEQEGDNYRSVCA